MLHSTLAALSGCTKNFHVLFLVRTGTYRHVLVKNSCTGMYRYILVRTGTYLYIRFCLNLSMYRISDVTPCHGFNTVAVTGALLRTWRRLGRRDAAAGHLESRPGARVPGL